MAKCTCATWWRQAPAKDELLYRSNFRNDPRAGEIPHQHAQRLEHQPVPLPHHGADYGAVLVGMQVPRGEMSAFKSFLGKAGIPLRRRDAQSATAVSRLAFACRLAFSFEIIFVRVTNRDDSAPELPAPARREKPGRTRHDDNAPFRTT